MFKIVNVYQRKLNLLNSREWAIKLESNKGQYKLILLIWPLKIKIPTTPQTRQCKESRLIEATKA